MGTKPSFAQILQGQPHSYFCVAHKRAAKGAARVPGGAAPGRKLFFTDRIHVYTSADLANQAAGAGDEVFQVDCLHCFLQAVRESFGPRTLVINDEFDCEIRCWRSYCQTTAVHQDANGNEYYLEGCADTGSVWKPLTTPAATPPEFLVCGASEFECIWGICPQHRDVAKEAPATLCEVRHLNHPHPPGVNYVVCVRKEKARFYYAGIGEDGLEFTSDRKLAAQLNYESAENVARAAADVHLNWVEGMASRPGHGAVFVLDVEGHPLTELRPPVRHVRPAF